MLKEERKLPVDVRGSKTSVLKLSIIRTALGALIDSILPAARDA